MPPPPRPRPVMATDKASNLCHNQSLSSIVATFNNHLGTRRGKELGLQEDIEACREAELDIGTAYALLRVRWARKCEHCGDTTYVKAHDPEGLAQGPFETGCQCLICTYRANSTEWASKLHHELAQMDYIRSPYSIPPRRMWDLFAHRVVPFSATQPVDCPNCHVPAQQISSGASGNKQILQPARGFHAISHSWVDARDRQSIKTPVNQQHWRVPIPVKVTLEAIRDEMLDKVGAEYAWLDVLCLRQQDDYSLEDIRSREWSSDVPTIGNVYQMALGVMRYFNGLGVPFKSGNVLNPRHWLNRAWTLQEIRPEHEMHTGAVPEDILIPMNALFFRFNSRHKLRTLYAPLAKMALECQTEDGCSIIDLVREMMNRESSNAVDKVSGINYLLGASQLPKYSEREPVELAWLRCVTCLRYMLKLELLFNFPIAGPKDTSGHLSWKPHWKNMTLSLPDVMLSRPKVPVDWDDKNIDYTLDVLPFTGGFALERCQLSRIEDEDDAYRIQPEAQSSTPRQEAIGFYTTHSNLNTSKVYIPDGDYVLLTHDLKSEHSSWVVCERVEKTDVMAWKPKRKWYNFGVTFPDDALLLRKVGILMTDETRLLRSDDHGFQCMESPRCYFI